MVEAMDIQTGFQKTDVGLIPSDWEVNKIDDFVIKVGSGITPTGGERVYKKEGRPFLRSQNVGWGNLILDDIAFIDDKTHNAFNSTEIQENDVFLNITGASIGRSAIADKRIVGGNVNQHVCIIRGDINKIESRYLNYFLLSYLGQKQINDFQAGGNRQGLNFGQIKSIQIPIPPTKAEQKTIATALNDADALITQLEELIAKKRAIKQGAMQELLKPKEGWEVKKLGEIGEIITGSTPPTQIKEYWNGSIPWITPTDINDKKDIFHSEREITNKGLQVTRKIPKNSLLVTCIASIGKNAILRNDGACNQQINAIIPNSNYNVDFLYYLVEINKNVLVGSAGITATLILSKKEFSELEFYFPRKSAQTRIAQILSDMDAEIEIYEKKLKKYKMIKRGMMQNLLTGKIRLV